MIIIQRVSCDYEIYIESLGMFEQCNTHFKINRFKDINYGIYYRGVK